MIALGLPTRAYFDVATVWMSAPDVRLNVCVAEMSSLDEATDLNKDESVDLFCETWEESLGDVRFKNCTVTTQASRYEVPYTGVAESYYENGQLRTSINYKAGSADGLVELYFENGQLETKLNNIAGVRNGLYERYWEDGQLRSKGNYIAGELDGLAEIYFENGQLRVSENYIAGERINSQCWNERGRSRNCPPDQ
jgi:hypothetical protein